MKRHGFLWDKIVNYDNLLLAHKNASKGKKSYRQVKKIDKNIEQNILDLILLLNSGKYKTSSYSRRIIWERGKEREIFRLPYWPDRVVQHAVVQVLAPIWQSSMIRSTYASIPGRGIHDARKRVLSQLRDNPDEMQYCLKIDIRKYYPSINHNKLKEVLRKKIKDTKVLELLDGVVESISVQSEGTGIPIGNYLSQWFANVYLSELDWRMKQQYKILGYHRYCDDCVIFHTDKSYLHQVREEITEWLWSEYKLTVKDNWQVFSSKARGIDFVGYRMWAEKTLLRKATKKRMAKKMSVSRGKKSVGNYESGIRSLPSYNGWTIHTSAYELRKKILSPWIEMVEK